MPRADHQRIRQENHRRRIQLNTLYSEQDPCELWFREQRVSVAEALFQTIKFVPDAKTAALDVGCGSGTWIQQLLNWGVSPQSICGIDLDANSLVQARKRFASVSLGSADATSLPCSDEEFDLVVVSTVLSSVLPENDRAEIGREIVRVMKPGGVVICYDFRYPSPGNATVRPVTVGELQGLFSEFTLTSQTTTLLPPIARRLVPRMSRLAELLVRLPPLRSHFVAVAKKPQ